MAIPLAVSPVLRGEARETGHSPGHSARLNTRSPLSGVEGKPLRVGWWWEGSRERQEEVGLVLLLVM